jgi:hypothetical protein
VDAITPYLGMFKNIGAYPIATLVCARFRREFHNEMQSFSWRDLPIFSSREDALRGLVTGD